jgi:hypothetical protein
MAETFGIHVDRLVTIEMKRSGVANRGVILPLYEAAYRAHGRALALLAAVRLMETVKRGDYVLITTGSGRPPWRPRGESDGPLGTASLGRALKLGLGARPVYIAAEPYLPPVIAASEAAGITPSYDRKVAEFDGFYPTALVRPFTLKKEDALDQSRALLDELEPAAVVAIETMGPNLKGVLHSANGHERPSEVATHAFHLTEEATRRGILTVGMADFGNEVGSGVVAKELIELRQCWAKCKCPCGSDPLCHVPSDVLVVGAISNWAAYGVSACLAYLQQDPSILQSPEMERRMGLDCTYAGAEGEAGMKQPWVDGTSPETQEAVVTMLHMLVENALKQPLNRGW